MSSYPQFETNLMSNRKVIELLLQLKRTKAHGKNYKKLKRTKAHGKNYKKSNHTAIFCVIIYSSISSHIFINLVILTLPMFWTDGVRLNTSFHVRNWFHMSHNSCFSCQIERVVLFLWLLWQQCSSLILIATQEYYYARRFEAAMFMILWVIWAKNFHLVSILQLWRHAGLVSIQKVTDMGSSMWRNRNFKMTYLEN